MEFKELIKQVKTYSNNVELIERAYDFASKAHSNQIRESGQEHISHLVGSSKILADLKIDITAIAACLLHDVLEDTKISKEELKKEFGDEISNLVDGVTKIAKLTTDDFESRQAENLRKMLIASTKDIRVMLIKIADRLDNMRSLSYLREDKQKRIAKETLEIYAPIAYRLGLANIKWQLEDLAFRYLEPKIYQDLKEKVARTRHQREIDVQKIRGMLEKKLRESNINFEISGRAKNFYSIYKKITDRNYTLEGMCDLIALRIIVDEVKDCYEVLGIIHNLFKPIQEKFRDYIANPKPNGYRSLHTIVLINNEQVEFQIRTKEMHKIAEEGIAAHWQYKKIQGDENFQKKLGWIKQILNVKSNSNKDFLETLKIDLFGDKIFIFTPKHDIIEIPKDGTVLDFAYAVHTDLGNKCTGARVNNKFVSIKHELQNGDVVEILTAKNQRPSREWLKIVKSTKSRDRIKHTLQIHETVPISKTNKPLENRSNIIYTDTKAEYIKIGDCCGPLPGDEIIGLSTKNNKITVHKINCDKLKEFKLKRIKAYWNNGDDITVNLKINAHDRIGLFADILNMISSLKINVEKADIKTVSKDLSECNIRVNISSLRDAKDVIDKLKEIADVKKVSLN